MSVAQIKVYEKKDTGYLHEISTYNNIVDIDLNYIDEYGNNCFQIIFRCLGTIETATFNKTDYGYTTVLFSELDTGF